MKPIGLHRRSRELCEFCAKYVRGNMAAAPHVDDDGAWARRAVDHEKWCSWIKNRAWISSSKRLRDKDRRIDVFQADLSTRKLLYIPIIPKHS